MNELDYKPNSHKSKENKDAPVEDKKVEKIVKGVVKTKKKNEIRKLADVFISEDVANVKSYIFEDVLIPSIKKAISDIVGNGIDMILFGKSGIHKSSSNASKISYRSYYERDKDRRPTGETRTRSGYSYDEIVLDSRGEAEDVLSRMEELISTYGLVSVADLYDLVGITGNYTDNKYGWTDIRIASVARVRDGYLLKLPKALPLD